MFAAYSESAKAVSSSSASEVKTDNEQPSQKDWLANSSFPIPTQLIPEVQNTPSPGGKSCGSCKDEDVPEIIFERKTQQKFPTLNSSSSSICSVDEEAGEVCTFSPSRLSSQNEAFEQEGRNASAPQDKPSHAEHDDNRRISTSSISSRSSSSSGDERYRKNRKSRSKSKRRKRSRTRSRSRSRNRRHKKGNSDKEKKKQNKHSRERVKHSSHNKEKPENKYKSKTQRENQREIEKYSDGFEGVMYEDRTRAFGNLSVTTLSRPAIPFYKASRFLLGVGLTFNDSSKRRKQKKYRYYNRVLKEMEKELKNKTSDKASDGGEPSSCKNTDREDTLEQELSQTRAKFNSDLASEPNNVDLWLKFAYFQDVLHQFECTYRRGGGAAGSRVTRERKLAILDKALELNPGCESLLKERCLLAEVVLPSDKLKSQLKELTEKIPGNLTLWDALIMATQGSLSSCRVPAVIALYREALKNVNALRRGSLQNQKATEEKLLHLFLHLGLFLRQAGLLELLWALLHVYLELNLAKLASNKVNISSTIADNALAELEDAILESQLPLPTLWLRIEMLRTGTHWISLPAGAECEDPQRMVFPEDISELIHPINTPQLTFRLVTITLTLLKVPLLPWRETPARAAGLHPLPWMLDGPEPLYASLLQLGTLEFTEMSSLLSDAVQLASGPQYLIARPGQDEYIDFITQVFSCCADCLPVHQQTYIFVWWLRFYRWLMQLERLGHCKLPRGRRKKLRGTAKELLRKDCNRNNLLLFREFALLEWENGSFDGAMKVLQGAIEAQPVTKPVPFSSDRAALCSLYRTLVELHLCPTRPDKPNTGESQPLTEEKRREYVVRVLVSLGCGTPLRETNAQSKEITAALEKFHHVSRELGVDPMDGEKDKDIYSDVCHLSPTFFVEWTACHAWLLFLEQSIWKAAALFETALSEQCPQGNTESHAEELSVEHPSNFSSQQRESLFEAYTALLRHHCYETRGSFSNLRSVLFRALSEFPGNLSLVAAFAELETSSSGSGLPLWRLSKAFYDIDSSLAHVLLVFVMRHRLRQQEAAARSALTLLKQSGPEIVDPAVRSRMTTLLQKLTKHPTSRRCPLLWRLRLQFAAVSSTDDKACHNAFYLAVEECPWVKALYMDNVQVLPMQLAQVQDLLIEKELRLHVTPEELEILRPDT